MTIDVQVISADSDVLGKVWSLYRAHSATLGFMPEGAFKEHAADGRLIVATDLLRNLHGYVMYRTTQRRATIVHLCVAPFARGTGAARKLFEGVLARVGHLDEVQVRCRRDYEAATLWPRLGFVPVKDVRGRGQAAELVTIWRREIAPLPLLARLAEQRSPHVLQVALDANVFFDLDNEADQPNGESRALLADWLAEFVDLCLTDEIYQEINRQPDDERRARQRERISGFSPLLSNPERSAEIVGELERIIDTSDSSSSASDLRQLANTIAAGVSYFVTRDGVLLRHADEIYDKYEVEVLRPFELVLGLDEAQRGEEYRPRRLFAGGRLLGRKPRTADVEPLVELTHAGHPAPEPRRVTTARVREILADPVRNDCTVVDGEDGRPLIAYALDRSEPGVLRVPMLAAAGTTLGRTAARHYLEHIVGLASHEGRTAVLVPSEMCGDRVEAALEDANFSVERGAWTKLSLPLIGTLGALLSEVTRVAHARGPAHELAARLAEHLRRLAPGPAAGRGLVNGAEAADVERLLWPAKLLEADLPCFVVPIRPHWAVELFDHEMAAGTLFGGNPGLVMSPENAYYRSARPATLTAPARVLWYVSDDDKYPGSMSIRASSMIDEVVVGKPKDVFRQFRRLGVYAWRDICRLAEGNLDVAIMAFRFILTEQFRNPISFADAQMVLRSHDESGSQFQSPTRVSSEVFFTMYRRGR